MLRAPWCSNIQICLHLSSSHQCRTGAQFRREKLQKPRTGKKTSAPARPVLGMRQPKGSIRLLEAPPCRWSPNLTRQSTARSYTHARLPGTSHRRPAPTGPGAQPLFSLSSVTSGVPVPLPLQVNDSRRPYDPSSFSI